MVNLVRNLDNRKSPIFAGFLVHPAQSLSGPDKQKIFHL